MIEPPNQLFGVPLVGLFSANNIKGGTSDRFASPFAEETLRQHSRTSPLCQRSFVLEVSPLALSVPDIDSNLGFIHTLFAVEDIHGARAEKHGDEVHIVFDGSKRIMDDSIFKMLSAWADQSAKLRNGEIRKEQYDRWRYTFPAEDTTQIWAKVPSQELSDMLIAALKEDDK